MIDNFNKEQEKRKVKEEGDYNTSPARLLIVVSICVFVIESLIMIFLNKVTLLSSGMEVLVDASLMTIFLIPFLYLLLFRPMTKHIKERKRFEEELKEKSHALGERVKELDGFFGTFKLISERALSVDDVLNGIVKLIPPAWQYPEITCGSIQVDGKIWKGDDFKETQWRISADIVVNSVPCGSLEVYYQEERPALYEGPFQKEERELIDALAMAIGRYLGHRKNIEDLQDSEEKLSTITSSVRAAIIMIDSFGKISFWNEGAQDIFGYTKDEVAGRFIHDIIIPQGLIERHKEGFAHFQETGEGPVLGSAVELSAVRKDATLLPVSLLISGVRIKGQWHAVAIINDITERKEREEALIKAHEELKRTQEQVIRHEKMASIGQLAAGVAHEINNPMSFILSNLQTMEKYGERLLEFIDIQSTAIEGLDEEDRINDHRRRLKIDIISADLMDMIDESKNGAYRVKHIVDDLKVFASVKGEDTLEAYDINGSLENALQLVRIDTASGVALIKDYGDLPKMPCYPLQLTRVFVNIIENAAHAVNDHGEIKITTRQEANNIIIEISDTGPGITAQNQLRLFDPFFTTKDVGTGTGLGLSISYDIIKNHNGELSVSSAPGKGATFIITLPIVESVS